MAKDVLHRVIPKDLRDKCRPEPVPRGGSQLTFVAMPCCGTSRGLHDNDNDEHGLHCRKCGKHWYVTYIGSGKFRFRRSPSK